MKVYTPVSVLDLLREVGDDQFLHTKLRHNYITAAMVK